jgi:hypothetical protein
MRCTNRRLFEYAIWGSHGSEDVDIGLYVVTPSRLEADTDVSEERPVSIFSAEEDWRSGSEMRVNWHSAVQWTSTRPFLSLSAS